MTELSPYDPFAPGPYAVNVAATGLRDVDRALDFPVEVWSPGGVGAPPLVIYSHYSGGHRKAATFLCMHLASHGYLVAAMDHFEVVARAQLPADRAARIEAVIGGRVPDLRLLMDHFGQDDVGLVGHSFGGWAVLAVAEVDRRVASVVAMGAGGGERARPGILPMKLTFKRLREVPTMFLAADNDVPIPLELVEVLFERTPRPKSLFVLRGADHQHFLDDVEGAHEAVRHANFPSDAAWIPAGMRPIAELTSGEHAHVFVRGLTLAHLDANLRRLDPAQGFLAGDVQAQLARRGVDAVRSSPSTSGQ